MVRQGANDPSCRCCGDVRHRAQFIRVYPKSEPGTCSTEERTSDSNRFTQVRYVSLSTNIFTGLHSVCLLAVMLWFICQLRHGAKWAKWCRSGRETLIRSLHSECGFLVIMLLLPVSMPILLQEKSIRNFHLRRNIYWYICYIDEL